jgi:hypothetical protein
MKKTKYELYLAGIISESQYEFANNVPNMDSMTQDQLLGFVAMYKNPRPEESMNLTGIKNPEDAMDVARLLSFYASNKKKAMEDRLKGDMNSALAHEEECERIYERLPDEVKW